MNVTYTEEAIADILDAIAYLHERNPAAASNLDADVASCIEHLAAGDFDGPLSRLRSGSLVRSWPVPPFRIYYQRCRRCSSWVTGSSSCDARYALPSTDYPDARRPPPQRLRSRRKG